MRNYNKQFSVKRLHLCRVNIDQRNAVSRDIIVCDIFLGWNWDYRVKQNQKQKIYWSTQQIIEQRITKMMKNHLVEMLNKAIIIVVVVVVVVVVIIIIIIIIYNEEQRNRSKKQIFTAGSLGNLD